MATSPIFVKNFKLKATKEDSISFIPTANTRLYSAYCSNASGAGTASITVKESNAIGSTFDIDNFSFNLFKQFSRDFTAGESQLEGGVYYETLAYKGLLFPSANISASGTFPLTNDAEIDMSIDQRTGNSSTPTVLNLKVSVAASDTFTQVCEKIVTAFLAKFQPNIYSFSNNLNTKELPIINYQLGNGSVKSFPVTYSLDGGVVLYSDLTDVNVTGLNYSAGAVVDASYGTPTLPSNFFGVSNAKVAATDNTDYYRIPEPSITTTKSDVWNTSGGTAGTINDPHPIYPDLKSKLELVISGGLNSETRFFSGNNEDLTVTELGLAQPILSSKTLASSESVELLSDVLVPSKLIDAQGNKFIPLSVGQIIEVDAAVAETITITYSEE